ncbi:MAG: porin [Pseudomonadota bacterium]
MFKRHMLAGAIACAFPLPALAAADADLAALRAEFDQKLAAIQAEYEARLKAMESRLAQAETQPQSSASRESGRDRLGAVSSGSGFNPQMSVILDGVYYTDNRRGAGMGFMEEIDGINHAHDHEGHSHGETERGFNLRATEVAFSATVDPWFDANLLLTVDSGGGVEVEEAYFDTRSLPAGWKIRGGKFLSGVGYLNNQHPHTWDFVDQNLAYRTLLGEHGIMDTGLQLTWTPRTGSVYTLLGVEALQSNEQVFGTAGEEVSADRADGGAVGAGNGGTLSREKAGPRLFTAFAKFAPDLGDNHALQIGVWGARARQHQEIHDHTDEDGLGACNPAVPASCVHALEGDSWLWGTDWVYKYDAPGAYGQGDIKLSAEYIWERKDLTVAFHENPAVAVGTSRKLTQDGLYLAGVYGIAPNWQLGLRYDVTGLTNKVEGAAGTLSDYNDSDRWTLSLTHHFSEFSRLRLQASTADLWVEGAPEKVNQFFLQYQHSLGAHGAHAF